MRTRAPVRRHHGNRTDRTIIINGLDRSKQSQRQWSAATERKAGGAVPAASIRRGRFRCRGRRYRPTPNGEESISSALTCAANGSTFPFPAPPSPKSVFHFFSVSALYSEMEKKKTELRSIVGRSFSDSTRSFHPFCVGPHKTWACY